MHKRIEDYFGRLFPLNRSLTGNGNRKTLEILSELVDFNIHEIPSGTNCFDWTVPPEWNVRDAWVKNSKGEKIIDFSKLNLHLLGYSEPVHKKMGLEELKTHLYTLPDMPDVVPYVTSYYQKRWGFCLTHKQWLTLTEDEYEVFIDSTLDEKGSMTYAEAYLPGQESTEILFSTYICHPSLANNELSGPLVTAFIYENLKNQENRRYSYRFLFIPETIGSIAYLSLHGQKLKENLIAGFVVTCIGDAGNFTYKKSRRGNTLPDRAVELLLKQTEADFTIHDFFPSGSDERQYCSPGFNLPIGSLMRTMYGTYPEYHTSNDNKDFISFNAMEQSVQKYLDTLHIIENNYTYLNKIFFCEPQLGKRGLYSTLGASKTMAKSVEAMMWLLNQADGSQDIIEIGEKSKCSILLLIDVAEKLYNANVLEKVDNNS
jgi:aminopeptidase-like protein